MKIGQRRYRAFISYSHSDEAFASRFHKSLERWRTPRRLVGSAGRDGAVEARLFPIFRDREELPTSADLGGVIRAALEGSRYLIVICSPRAAASVWVGQEILQFKRIHGEGRIIAALIEGEPSTAFPEAIRYRLGPDGTLSTEEVEPIAADFRRGKDGWRLGLLKVLAGVLGVNLDDLVLRERRRQRLHRLTLTATAAVIAAAGVFAADAWRERERVQTAVVQADRGLSDIRAGAVFSGAARFLSASDALGDAAGPDGLRLATALRTRLLPFDEAKAELEEGAVIRWRDRTYRFEDSTLTPVPYAEYYAETDGLMLLSHRGDGISAYAQGSAEPVWRKPFEPGEELCGLWQDQETGRGYFEGTYIGMTIGSSYGFHGWLDLETGAVEHIGHARVFESVCTGDDTPRIVDGTFARLDRAVSAFDWPRLRREFTLWDLADFMSQHPFLPDTAGDAVRDGIVIWHGEEVSGLEVFDWHTPRAFQCSETTFAYGLASVGNSGGTWAMCAGGEMPVCQGYDFIGAINNWAVAPDCSMIAAMGAGLTDRRGLALVGPDLAEKAIAWQSAPNVTSLGVWSASGALFAATDGADRIFVFQRNADGLSQLATHQAGEMVGALVFLGDDGLAFLTESGALRAISARSGVALWPSIMLGPRIGLALTTKEAFEDEANGVLLADRNGERLALLMQMDATEAYRALPNLQPRTMDGELAPPDPDQFTSFARFFDARLGVPLGNVLPLSWVTGPYRVDGLWKKAHLSRREDGVLVLSFENYGAFSEKVVSPSGAAPEFLTGFGPDGTLISLELLEETDASIAE